MSETKQLTNKELKELKKKEKLEKRAAQKTAAGIPTNPQLEAGKSNHQQKNKKQEGPNNSSTSPSVQEDKKVALFSHLETKTQRKEIGLTNIQISKSIHPSVLKLTLKYSSYSIVGSIRRCQAMLDTFKIVIQDYKTPESTTLTRNLTNYLSLQIDYLKTARPLSVTMGNAIRWLKQEISVIPIDRPELEAKKELLEKIDSYLREKIELSDKLIIQSSSVHISENSTVLTYGHSNVLKELFLYNHQILQKKFQVIIIDSRPLFEGKKLAKELTDAGLKVKYSLINSISTMFQDNDIDFVFLGAHAMLSNGFLYSRVGTSLIAMKAKNKNIPVLVCCESIKFSDRVQLDAVTLNELGDPNDLVEPKEQTTKVSNNVALKDFLKTMEKQASQQQQQQKKKGQQQQQQQQQQRQQKQDEKPEASGLQQWENTDYLNILSIMYDLTPPEYIQKIITEVGALPPSSVPVIIREYKNQ